MTIPQDGSKHNVFGEAVWDSVLTCNQERVGSLPIFSTKFNAPVAQMVEQWIEDPCVGGSIPSGAPYHARVRKLERRLALEASV